MGNTLRELNEKIEKDKRREVDQQYANELMDQQEENEYSEQSSQSSSYSFSESKYNREQRLNRSEDTHRIINDQLDHIVNKRDRIKEHRIIGQEIGLLLRILSSVIRKQQQATKQSMRQKYHWQELANAQKQLQQLRRNTNNNNNPQITKNRSLQLRKILLTDSKNNNNIKFCFTQLMTKPIIVSRITIDIQQQLLQNRQHYSIQHQQHYYKRQKQYQQQLTHYNEINRVLYEWRTKVAKQSLRYTQNQLPLVHIYQVQNQYELDQQHISKNIFNLFNINNQNYSNTNNNSNKLKQYKLTLYQQHIPYRLSDLRTLTNLQGLYVLEQSFLGFMMLYQVVGEFDIHQDMIGFTYDGIAKVWLSPLFYTNLCRQSDQLNMISQQFIFTNQYSNPNTKHIFSQRNKLTKLDKLAQQKMVTRIYMIIQKYSLFNKHFIDFTRGFRNSTFKSALNLIQTYKYQLVINSDRLKHSSNKNERVKFVTRVRVQGEESSYVNDQFQFFNKCSDNCFYNNNLFMKQQQNKGNTQLVSSKYDKNVNVESLNINGKPLIDIKQINPLNPSTNYAHTQKPIAPTMSSLSSHITLLNNKPNNQRVRPIIFNQGYQRSMSNNESQRMSQFSQNEYQTHLTNNNNNSIMSRINKQKKQQLIRSNATFVTIKSQQR